MTYWELMRYIEQHQCESCAGSCKQGLPDPYDVEDCRVVCPVCNGTGLTRGLKIVINGTGE